MVMLNDLDRFHLVMDVIDRVPGLGSHAASLRQRMADDRVRARAYTRAVGDDDPEIQRLDLALLTCHGDPDASPCRQRRLEQPQAVGPRRGRQHRSPPKSSTRPAAGSTKRQSKTSCLAQRPDRRRRPSGRARWHGVHRPGTGRCRRRPPARDYLTDLAPLHQPKSLEGLER